jgi:hypothetical protein
MNTLKAWDTLRLIVGMADVADPNLQRHQDSLKLQLCTVVSTKTARMGDCFVDRAQTKVSIVLSATDGASFDDLCGVSAFSIENNEVEVKSRQ